MKFIGDNLKKSRLRKKINISQISKDLNISHKLLKAIEADDFSEEIDKVYLLGHIRSYAKYLSLNEEEIIQDYKIQISYDNKPLDKLPKPMETLNLFSVSKSLSLFSILILGVSFYYFFIRSVNIQQDYAITPDIPENMQMNLEKIEMEIELARNRIANSLISSQTATLESIELSIIDDDKFVNSTTSAVASLSDTNNINELKNIVTLKFLNPTWIQLRNSEDQIIFSKLMYQNTEYSYSLLDDLYLTAGNAGNIIVSIDGETRGKVGKIGEVIESLIIDSKFDN